MLEGQRRESLGTPLKPPGVFTRADWERVEVSPNQNGRRVVETYENLLLTSHKEVARQDVSFLGLKIVHISST